MLFLLHFPGSFKPGKSERGGEAERWRGGEVERRRIEGSRGRSQAPSGSAMLFSAASIRVADSRSLFPFFSCFLFLGLAAVWEPMKRATSTNGLRSGAAVCHSRGQVGEEGKKRREKPLVYLNGRQYSTSQHTSKHTQRHLQRHLVDRLFNTTPIPKSRHRRRHAPLFMMRPLFLYFPLN